MGFTFHKHRIAGAIAALSTYLAQDIGATGWTIPTPTPVTGAATTWSGATQNGSRIFYVDPVNGNDATGSLYFMFGGTLCDPSGSSAGAGSVAYGTDPLNPSGPILPFKTYARVAPKNGADYTDNAATQIGSFVPSPTRVGFPDYILLKRGTTLSLYSDMRSFLDGTTRTTTPVYLYGGCLVTAGGRSSAEKAVVGSYGPTSAGRARVIDPIYQLMALGGGSARSYELFFGLTIDGMARDRAVRPVDWGVITKNDMQMFGATYLGMGPTNLDIRFEDMHFYGTTGLNMQWASTHTGAPVLGFTMFRSLVTDSWDEDSLVKAEARKATGDPDQTFTAGTTTQITWPTLASGFNFATNTYTTQADAQPNAGYFSLWYNIDMTATVPTNGTIEIVPFVNGVEVAGASISVPGIGGSASTYKLHGLLRTGFIGGAGGKTLTVSARVTGGSGTVTILGNQFSRLVVSKLNLTGCQGVYLQAAKALQFSITENVLVRNGFGSNPLVQTSFMPSAGGFPYDWDIYNHNFYFVGDCDVANCHADNNVLILGAAGPVLRSLASYNANFIYEGYFGIAPEHKTNPYTVSAGSFNDNVMQKFVSPVGHNGTAHPGDGVSFGNGSYGFQARRNIISDVACGNTGRSGIGINSIVTPYYPPNALYWSNDTTNSVIDGNIFDATNPSYYAYGEGNGQQYDFVRYNAPITGTISTGSTVTCTPTAGYTGTPTYQWFKYQNGSNVSAIITGETANTYILRTAATGVGGTVDVVADAFGGQGILVSCAVSGITYPAGVGIKGTTVTNNKWVTPGFANAGTFSSIKTYFNMNSAGGDSSISGTHGATSTPTTSDTAFVSTTNPVYATRSAATTALGWPNSEASLKSHLASLGLIVNTSDGVQELYSTAIGATPVTTALRRGKWDGRLAAKAIGNTVRSGRGMATLP